MSKKPKEIQKCGFSGCYDDAIWKATATQESIDKIPNDENRNKHLFKVGSWYYCDRHRKIVEGYCPHLQFEKL